MTFSDQSWVQFLPGKHRAEIELLLSCARNHASSSEIESINTHLQHDIDWEFFVQLAIHHRVAALVYRSLQKVAHTSLPAHVLEQLRSHYRFNAVRNLLLAQELLNVLEQLKAYNIPAIPLKGSTLSIVAYGDLTIREFCDLDLLIPEEKFETAIHLLTSTGYRPASERQWFFNHTPILKSLYQFHLKHSVYALPLIRTDGKVILDLHKQLMSELPYSFYTLWQRIQSIALLNSTAPGLQVEDLLLYLCIHGSKHQWKELTLVCDITELIRNQKNIDWEQLIQRSQELGCERMLTLGLTLASHLCNAPLPLALNQKLQANAQLTWLLSQVYHNLWCQTDCSNPQASWKEFCIFYQMLDRSSDRIRYSLGFIWFRCVGYFSLILPTLDDQEFLPLPRSLNFLYLLVRPIRLFKKYGFRRSRELNQML
jgi:hypothetical protein